MKLLEQTDGKASLNPPVAAGVRYSCDAGNLLFQGSPLIHRASSTTCPPTSSVSCCLPGTLTTKMNSWSFLLTFFKRLLKWLMARGRWWVINTLTHDFMISCTASPNERHRWDERPKRWEEVVTPLNRWLSLPYLVCTSLVVVVFAWPNMSSNTVCSYWNSHLLATGNVHRRGALAPTHFQSCRLHTTDAWNMKCATHMYHSKAEKKKSGGATS